MSVTFKPTAPIHLYGLGIYGFFGDFFSYMAFWKTFSLNFFLLTFMDLSLIWTTLAGINVVHISGIFLSGVIRNGSSQYKDQDDGNFSGQNQHNRLQMVQFE